MTGWSNYSPDQVRAVAAVLPPLGERGAPVTCPSCGHRSVRWYGYLNPFRRGSKIVYVWCGDCRHYYGSTTAGAVPDDLPDPLGESTPTDRSAAEADLAAFFARLDDLWRRGDLPQVRPAAR